MSRRRLGAGTLFLAEVKDRSLRFALASIALALAAPAVPASASVSPSAIGNGSAEIRAPAGITVIRDVISQSNISFTVIGRTGDAVTVGVPGSVNVTSSSGQKLTLDTTNMSQVQFASATILGGDSVSISVGAEFNGQVADETYDEYSGVMVVLAQYN